jgi:hypothetical protein
MVSKSGNGEDGDALLTTKAVNILSALESLVGDLTKMVVDAQVFALLANPAKCNGL